MTTNGVMPKWSTPDRRKKLVDLFTSSGGFCVFGQKDCLIPAHHYELFIEDLIADWKRADREDKATLWYAEMKAIHSLGEHTFHQTGMFNEVSHEIYCDSQPLFYIQALGIGCVSFKPFAKVRLSSSYIGLYVDLGDSLRTLSKSKRRKVIRYGKRLPEPVQQKVVGIVQQAVNHYLSH